MLRAERLLEAQSRNNINAELVLLLRLQMERISAWFPASSPYAGTEMTMFTFPLHRIHKLYFLISRYTVE